MAPPTRKTPAAAGGPQLPPTRRKAPAGTTSRRRGAAPPATPAKPRQKLSRPAAAMVGWAAAQILASGLYLGTCIVQTGTWGRCNTPWVVFLGTIYAGGQGTLGLLTEAFRGANSGALLQGVLEALQQQAAGAGQPQGRRTSGAGRKEGDREA